MNLVTIEGSPGQVQELHRMVSNYKMMLLGLGGNDAVIDICIEERLQKASYWIEECEAKLENAKSALNGR